MAEPTIKPPIVLDDEGSPEFFATVRGLQAKVEAYDVVDGSLTIAYDSEGRLLRLSAGHEGDIVAVTPAEEQPGHAAELRELLVDYFRYFDVPGDWLAEATLEELVTTGLAHSGRPPSYPTPRRGRASAVSAWIRKLLR